MLLLTRVDTALMTAQSKLSLEEAKADRELWGRLVESAAGECELFDWRERNREVDFVVRAGRTVTAIKVKSGRRNVATRVGDKHLCVVVKMADNDAFVLTAYLMSRPAGGRQLWPRSG